MRAGQKYWPLSGKRRQAFIVQSVTTGGVVRGRHTENTSTHVKTTAQRILATKATGEGRYYSFLAWMPRRYQTWAVAMVIDDSHTKLVFPEWHPGRPTVLPTRLLPPDSRYEGAWLTLQADLSVVAGGQLNPSNLCSCEDPGPARCARPTWDPQA